MESFEDILKDKIQLFCREKKHLDHVVIEKEIVNVLKEMISVEDKIYKGNEFKNNSCIANTINPILCSSGDVCVNSHTIAENQLCLLADKNKRVLFLKNGMEAYFKNRFKNFPKLVSSRYASSFYGFCQKCENEFTIKGIDDFQKIDKKNFALFFYRFLTREYFLTKTSIHINNNYINGFSNGSSVIKSFVCWNNVKSNIDLVDNLKDRVKSNLLSLTSFCHNIVMLYSIYSNDFFKDDYMGEINVNDFDCLQYNYNYENFVSGACILSCSVSTIFGNFSIPSFVVFGSNNGKQSIKIFAHKNFLKIYKDVFANKDSILLSFLLFSSIDNERCGLYFKYTFESKIIQAIKYIKEFNSQKNYEIMSGIDEETHNFFERFLDIFIRD